MEKKRSIVLAAEMLMNCYGYIGNRGKDDVTAFTFKVDSDGEGITVFSSTISSEMFYWPEDIVRIVTAFNLSCYLSLGRPHGQEHREQIVIRIR